MNGKTGLVEKAKVIYNGWAEFLKQNNPEIEARATKRAYICAENTCQKLKFDKILYVVAGKKEGIQEAQGYVCGQCNCPLSSKIRSEDSCPLNLW